jgi:hypothetical protein
MVVIAAVLLASFMLCGCALFPYGAPAPGIDPTRANPDDVIIGKPIGQTTPAQTTPVQTTPTQTTPVQTTPTQTTPVQTQNNTPVIGSNTTVGNESLNASMINASVVGNASAGNGTINTNGTAQNESQILLNETETSAKAQGTIKMLFLDVGMGDATLVKTADYTMLIDTGLAQNAQNLSDTLKELGVDEIDALVISSWSEQKTGGLDAILKRFAVYEVWVSKELPSSFFALDAMEILQKREAFVVNPKAGDAIVHGVLEIEVLNPQESEYANYAEANSIVLKINMGKFCAFLPSDLTQETEAPIVGKINSQCAVYKWRKN